MIVGRSMHERWLSNAYVVGDAPGGTAVFVDSGAPVGPLLEVVERESLTPTHLLRTHTHPDHIEHEDELCARFGIPVVTGISSPAASLRGRSRCPVTPTTASHSSSTTRSVSPATCCSRMRRGRAGRCLPCVRDAADGSSAGDAGSPRTYGRTTIAREFEHNPFVVYWRGAVPSLGEQVRVAGDDAELVVWSPDYDGNGKALVRFSDGREAIVGGSRVERG